jgi:hypothetical protein
MNNDNDDAMKNFEDLGRKLFQKKPDEAEVTEDDDDTTPPDED